MVNSGLTLHLSGFISCVFGSGILSSYCRCWDYLCLQGISPKSSAVIWPGNGYLRSECILVWSMSWLSLIVAISDLTLLGTQIWFRLMRLTLSHEPIQGQTCKSNEFWRWLVTTYLSTLKGSEGWFITTPFPSKNIIIKISWKILLLQPTDYDSQKIHFINNS